MQLKKQREAEKQGTVEGSTSTEDVSASATTSVSSLADGFVAAKLDNNSASLSTSSEVHEEKHQPLATSVSFGKQAAYSLSSHSTSIKNTERSQLVFSSSKQIATSASKRPAEAPSQDVSEQKDRPAPYSGKKICMLAAAEQTNVTNSQMIYSSPDRSHSSSQIPAPHRSSPRLVASAKKRLLQAASESSSISLSDSARKAYVTSEGSQVTSVKKALYLAEAGNASKDSSADSSSKIHTLGQASRVARRQLANKERPGSEDSDKLSGPAIDNNPMRKSAEGVMTRRRLSLTKRKSEDDTGVSASKLPKVAETASTSEPFAHPTTRSSSRPSRLQLPSARSSQLKRPSGIPGPNLLPGPSQQTSFLPGPSKSTVSHLPTPMAAGSSGMHGSSALNTITNSPKKSTPAVKGLRGIPAPAKPNFSPDLSRTKVAAVTSAAKKHSQHQVNDCKQS